MQLGHTWGKKLLGHTWGTVEATKLLDAQFGETKHSWGTGGATIYLGQTKLEHIWGKKLLGAQLRPEEANWQSKQCSGVIVSGNNVYVIFNLIKIIKKKF